MSLGGNDIDILSRCEETHKALSNLKQIGILSGVLEKDFSKWIRDHIDELPVPKDQIQELIKKRMW